MTDPRVFIALAPLALYALVLAAVNLSRRPFLINSARDTAALGMALAGMILVGPFELLAPDIAFDQFQWMAWLMLGALYGLVVTLIILLQRPALVIYNLSLDQLRPVLAELLAAVEPDPRWAGNTVALPSLGVELHVESFPAMRNIRLYSVGDFQSFSGWRRLETALEERLAGVETQPSYRGLAFLSLGIGLFLASSYGFFQNSEAVVQALEQMLRVN